MCMDSGGVILYCMNYSPFAPSFGYSRTTVPIHVLRRQNYMIYTCVLLLFMHVNVSFVGSN